MPFPKWQKGQELGFYREKNVVRTKVILRV